MSQLVGFKVVLIGDGRVGKTSIRRTFMGKHFVKPHLMTLGADFSSQNLDLTLNNITYEIKFSIWDIAGQDQFKTLRHRFYANANALLLVYDVTEKTSFDNLLKWLYEAWEVTSDTTIPFLLIGNKLDLNESRVIQKNTAINFLEALKKKYPKIQYCDYIETSALTGENINTMFKKIGEQLINRMKL